MRNGPAGRAAKAGVTRLPHLSPRAAGRLHMNQAVASGALSYPSPERLRTQARGGEGGQPKAGRVGGSHNGSRARGYPPTPASASGRCYASSRLGPTLPTRGRDYSSSSRLQKRAPTSYAIALPHAGRGEQRPRSSYAIAFARSVLQPLKKPVLQVAPIDAARSARHASK